MKKWLDLRTFARTLAVLATLGIGLGGQHAMADGGGGGGAQSDSKDRSAGSSESSAPPPGFRPSPTFRAASAAFLDNMIFMSPEEAIGTLLMDLTNPFAQYYLSRSYRRFYISPMDPDWMKYNIPLVGGEPQFGTRQFGTRIDLQEVLRKIDESATKAESAAKSGKPKASVPTKGKTKDGKNRIADFVGDEAYKKMLKEFGTEDAKAKAREKKLRREYFERHTPR